VCRIDGKVCFVPFSCPGDEVSLRIISEKKSYSTANIAEILKPSPLRVAPLCPLFGTCGGCNWQHIGYQAQLEQKRSIFADALRKGARAGAELIEEIIPATMQYGYRSRMQFKVSASDGSLRIGFFRHASHQIEDAANGCPIALPSINQVLKIFRELLRNYPAVGSVSQLSIDSGTDELIVIIHQTGSFSAENRNYFAEKSDVFAPCTGLFFLSNTQTGCEKIWGSSEISYRMNRTNPDREQMTLTYPPGGFAQVHQQQNGAILSVIRRFGAFSATDTLLDLYCGNGNFSLPLADEVASVVGVEGNVASIAAAEHNRLQNRVANARFFCDDVTPSLERLADQGQQFNKVLLDPPRAGAAEAVPGIARLRPDTIIYVSCDPSTLARDCTLLAPFGYRVVSSVPVDMFPQTYHIESVTLLKQRERQ
jgi:23S rRNA (uracil1939-C5)-methyltransferase